MTESRPCGRGEHCTDPTTDASGAAAPRWSTAPFCQRDRQLIAGALAELPQLFVELHLELPRAGAPPGERTSGGGVEAPVPLNLVVDALMREIVVCVVTWVEVCLEPDEWTIGVRSGVAVSRSCHALTAHLDALLALPRGPQARHHKIVELDGVDAGLELLQLKRRAYQVLGKTAGVIARPAPCAACGTYGLVTVRGSGVTRCEVCGDVTSDDEYHAWVHRLVGDSATT